MPVLRGRFAPSPTGRFHLGNARTALLAWLQVRAAGGRMVLRIEDLDPARSRRHYEIEQLEDLRWLGLDWDEGPDVGGPSGPYRQSERTASYARALTRLHTYPCTCSRRELRDAALAPHGTEPRYPGTCRVRGPLAGRPLAVRWQTPEGVVEFTDLVGGPVVADVRAEAGDFVLRRGDGAFAYQLAVVVDDAAMGITHVLRGADLRDSTARQILLQRELGLGHPTYAHVPLVLGPTGGRLAKRDGAPDLGALRRGGADPRAVTAWLARSVGLIGDEVTRVSATDLVKDFDVARLAKVDARIEVPMGSW